MSYKIKSVLYFASLVLTLVTYYHMDDVRITQTTELVENTIENVAPQEALN